MKNIIPFILFITLTFNISNGQENISKEETTSSVKDLAIQLANPIANLISIPFQNNYEFNVGRNNGFRYTLNTQPVIPISISENWNMISRTILPITFQKNVTFDGNTEFGIGDIVQSLFFSPKLATKNGIVWGVGPVLLLPTATNDALGNNKWAAGPNAVFLKLHGPFTFGFLINHMWSYAGSGASNVNASFFQPFASYANPKGSSFTLASENTQDWENDFFGGFVGIYYAKIVKIWKYTMQIGGGPKVYYGNNPFNPDWGIRVNVISLFPK